MKRLTRMLTSEQQHQLAHHIASGVKTSLIKAAEKRYMNEIHSYEEVGSAVEDSVKIILSSIIKVTDLTGE